MNMKKAILSLFTALSAPALSVQAASLVQPGAKVKKLAGGKNKGTYDKS
jgi:hypothetical protein